MVACFTLIDVVTMLSTAMLPWRPTLSSHFSVFGIGLACVNEVVCSFCPVVKAWTAGLAFGTEAFIRSKLLKMFSLLLLLTWLFASTSPAGPDPENFAPAVIFSHVLNCSWFEACEGRGKIILVPQFELATGLAPFLTGY